MAAPEGNYFERTFLNGCLSKAAAKICFIFQMFFFFQFAIWLPRAQLRAIIEKAASLSPNVFLSIFDLKVTLNAVTSLGP